MTKNVLIGSYTSNGKGEGGEGIYMLNIDTASGLIYQDGVSGICENPSFMAMGGSSVYVCEEINGASALSSVEIREGKPVRTGRAETSESGMCHAAVWPDGKHITVSNFGSASFINFSLNEDGSPGRLTQTERHEGSGPNARMQKTAHVHSATIYPGGNMMLVCDLGNDTLTTYRLFPENGTCECVQTVRVDPGDGPRHAAFSPDGKYVTVVMQLGNCFRTFEVTEDGLGRMVSRLSMLPEDVNYGDAADVHYSENGRFVYGSNRGHDSIIVCNAGTDGELSCPRWFPSFGSGPRNFCILPGTDLMIIANQVTGNVVSARVNINTGDISGKLCETEIPQAVFVLPLN